MIKLESLLKISNVSFKNYWIWDILIVFYLKKLTYYSLSDKVYEKYLMMLNLEYLKLLIIYGLIIMIIIHLYSYTNPI